MKTSFGPKRISINTKGNSRDCFNFLANHLLNGRQILTEPGLQVSRLEDGSIIELYGTGSFYPDYLFKKNNIVLSFKVDNVELAVKQLSVTGAKQLGNIENLSAEYAFCHLQLSDGTVIGIFQENSINS